MFHSQFPPVLITAGTLYCNEAVSYSDSEIHPSHDDKYGTWIHKRPWSVP